MTVTQAISQCHSILKMDTRPERFVWAQGEFEPMRTCMARRRNLLADAGKNARMAGRSWHELPESVRDALAGE